MGRVQENFSSLCGYAGKRANASTKKNPTKIYPASVIKNIYDRRFHYAWLKIDLFQLHVWEMNAKKQKKKYQFQVSEKSLLDYKVLLSTQVHWTFNHVQLNDGLEIKRNLISDHFEN